MATQRPWQQHYQPGTPLEINPDAYASLVALLETTCSRFADRPAFCNFGTTLNYADVERLSRDFAAYLQNAGFNKGDRIALMMPNVLQYPVALFGALRAGLTVVNTNPLYTPRELEHQLKDSGAECIVVLANFAHVVAKVLDRTRVRQVIVTELGDLLKFPKGIVISFAARWIKHLVPDYSIPDAVAFKHALHQGAAAEFTPPPIVNTDLALLQYTGGTTGVAKGVMLTHRNLVANLEQLSALWGSTLRDGEEIVITPLPLYHVFCFTCNCLLFTKHGALNVLITNPRDIPAFVAELGKWRFTFISGVTTLYQALLAHHGFKHLDFSALKFGVAGGMALHPTVAERWQAVTGRPMVEGYGLSEAAPVVACNLPHGNRIGTVGVPVPSTEIAIRDGDRELPLSEEGELCVRGPQVMQGYWNMPEETAKTLDRDGWLRTGDIAKLDADGYVRIVDRKKDMIIVSGFKVFPNEIESVLTSHEHVMEAGCIGVPDTSSGQAVKVFVVTRESATVTVEEIRAHCRENLTGYKVPKYVEFRTTLPKTNIGKVLRRALLEETTQEKNDQRSSSAH
jgi:long-chain acyl-CoA synthetase